MSKAEQAPYQLLESHGAIEIRHYPALIVAETEVVGKRKPAIEAGFRSLAAYIFGGNQKSERIAMTAPVMQGVAGDHWRVRFVMPRDKNLSDLPLPNHDRVSLLEVPPTTFAVIRYSGTAGEDVIARQTNLLFDFMRSRSLSSVGSPVYAFYNPPWTLPFLRRNEILVEISPDDDPNLTE